ncbi:head maturation protease, ClpP-related [Listeria booriae]|uniref:head maturation protease, ClpP-related n=1 Tax=Listeria booriae TaxID=1552123 RepID=UPI001625C767|nr:head maturation protease, ClpP-related [Listeria booriae]MBC2106142.1 Clp protease ClpP [Listeria booriae]
MTKKMNKITPVFKMENGSKIGEKKLLLHGDISADGWYGEISLRRIRQQLEYESFDTLHVHINSNGGDVFESIAISNYFAQMDAEVIVHIDGIAASGATIIAMAADKIIMPNNTMMMVHDASTIIWGNAKQLRKVADDLDKISTSASKTYETRFKGTTEELRMLMDKEEMLSADECLILGFADEVVGEIAVDTNTDDVKQSIVNKYASAASMANTTETKNTKQNAFQNLLKILGKEE